MNKPLGLEEVLALPDGAEVWVECPEVEDLSGTHKKQCDRLFSTDEDNPGWFSACRLGGYGVLFRAWSARPTDAEREAEAWQS